jgi:hypothetical protein
MTPAEATRYALSPDAAHCDECPALAMRVHRDGGHACDAHAQCGGACDPACSGPCVAWSDLPHAAALRATACADDPLLDGTDGAHPAWWRGHDRAAEMLTAQRDEARAELDASHSLIVRQGDILRGVANVLRGEPGPLASHGHHDLAERATEMRSRAEAAESLAAEALREGLAACRHLRGVIAGLRTQTADLLRAVQHRDRRVVRLTRERDAALGEVARLRAVLAVTQRSLEAAHTGERITVVDEIERLQRELTEARAEVRRG